MANSIFDINENINTDIPYDEFNKDQLYMIDWGKKSGIDISIYANPVYDWRQMDEIRRGLLEHLNVSIYAKPEFNWYQMHQIRIGLGCYYDVSAYAKPEYSWQLMKIMREDIAKRDFRRVTI